MQRPDTRIGVPHVSPKLRDMGFNAGSVQAIKSRVPKQLEKPSPLCSPATPVVSKAYDPKSLTLWQMDRPS